MNLIGELNRELYTRLGFEVSTSDVIITDERIAHIEARHPSDYARFCSYIPEMIAHPDYVIAANKPNTAVILKEITDGKERFKLILRFRMTDDPEGYLNSIISFWCIGTTTWEKTLRNKKILYKRE
ncbi:MAG: hypothetical protein E7469_09305 [Ruminococcaceae bacterium]|nr:hypothetical protein [Oscillospiraceae bacterium]